MNYWFRGFILTLGIFWNCALCAQQKIQLIIPDITLYANELVQGDSDTYGRGIWSSSFTLKIVDGFVNLEALIVFLENQGDSTLLKGKFQRSYPIPNYDKYQNCQFILPIKRGRAKGENFGARGFKTFLGKGILQEVSIQTDTFGEDLGKVGGIFKFKTIELIVIHPRA